MKGKDSNFAPHELPLPTLTDKDLTEVKIPTLYNPKRGPHQVAGGTRVHSTDNNRPQGRASQGEKTKNPKKRKERGEEGSVALKPSRASTVSRRRRDKPRVLPPGEGSNDHPALKESGMREETFRQRRREGERRDKARSQFNHTRSAARSAPESILCRS